MCFVFISFHFHWSWFRTFFFFYVLLIFWQMVVWALAKEPSLIGFICTYFWDQYYFWWGTRRLG